MKINAMYLCVKDMQRAINFYESFFDAPPIIVDDIYSVFEINGFRFGLFAFERMKEDHLFGSNCLPSIELESLSILKEKIQDKKIVFALTVIGKNYVCEILDSEGNHIELCAPVQN